MPGPSHAEQLALDEVGPLLRFAAERVANLDPNIALDVAQAIEAQEKGSWTPHVSQKFWDAFAKLSNLINPVTIDCIKAAQPTLPRKRWVLFGETVGYASLAGRTSARFLALLIVILTFALGIQLYAWAINAESDDLNAKASDAHSQSQKLDGDTAKLDALTRSNSGSWTTPELNDAATISQESKDLSEAASEALKRASSLRKWLTLRLEDLPPSPPVACQGTPNSDPDDQWWCKGERASGLWSYTADTIADLRSRTSLVSGILISFILPTLLGMAGALAFVIRTISDQIKSTTFSSASPLRHLMRVALGALMGAIVALFNGLTQQLDLSPLAIAFLAGYAVEATFSVFDGLVSNVQKAFKPQTG